MHAWHGHWCTTLCGALYYTHSCSAILRVSTLLNMKFWAHLLCARLYCHYHCRQISEEMKDGHFTQDHYRVLGVDHKASHDAIREAYLKLAKTHHPDVSNGPQSGERFKAIVSAWEVSLEFPQSTPCHTATLLTVDRDNRKTGTLP